MHFNEHLISWVNLTKSTQKICSKNTDETTVSATILCTAKTYLIDHKHIILYVIFFVILASELDLNSTFYIRLSYMPQDFVKSDLKYQQNWFSNKQDIKGNKIQYGVLDSYHDGTWKIQREKNYTYYTGEEGFSVPFVCEHQPIEIK